MKRTYAYVEVLVYVVRQVDVSPLSHSERTHLPLLTLVLLAGKASSLSAVGTTRIYSLVPRGDRAQVLIGPDIRTKKN